MILNTEQVAQLLECTTESVELAARQKRLPGVRFGRSWVFPVRALESALVDEALAYMHGPERPATEAISALKPVPGVQFGPLRVVPPPLPEPA